METLLAVLHYLRCRELKTRSFPLDIHRRREELSEIVDDVRLCWLLKTLKVEAR